MTRWWLLALLAGGCIDLDQLRRGPDDLGSPADAAAPSPDAAPMDLARSHPDLAGSATPCADAIAYGVVSFGENSSDDCGGTVDTTLASSAANGSGPTLVTLAAASDSDPTLRTVSLLRFDLAPLAGATIAAAELALEIENGSDDGQLRLFPPGVVWDQAATWSEARAGVPWTSTPCAAGPSGCGTAANLATPFATKGPVLLDVTDPVQAWLAATPNSGFVIAIDPAATGSHDVKITSSEGADGSRPSLIVWLN